VTVRVPLRAQVAGVGLLVLASLALPAARAPLFLLADWTAVALVLLGVRRHVPRQRMAWRLITLLVGLVAVSNTSAALGGSGRFSDVTTFGAQLAAAGALPLLLRVPRTGTAGRGAGSRLELTVAVVAVVSIAAEVFLRGLPGTAGPGGGLPGAAAAVFLVAPAVDILLLGALLRLIASRARLVPAMTLVLAGGIGCLSSDLLSTSFPGGAGLPPVLQAIVPALRIPNMPLFALAALHPTMVVLGDPAARRRARRPSVQVALLLPGALVPALLLGLHSVGAGIRLPAPVLAASTVLVLALVVARAFLVLREVEVRAERDPLTGLLNRHGLARAYARAQLQAQVAPVRADPRRHDPSRAGDGPPLALLLVDLDDFKRVNDQYGHGTGDAVLLAATQRLLAAVAGSGVVARHGGDEFIVLLRRSAAPPQEVAEAVHAALAAPVVVAGHALFTGASVGVVEVHAGDDLETALVDADIAMYAAKKAGKSRSVLFRPELRAQTLDAITLLDDLRELLDGSPVGDVGELVVHYQPVVDLRTGRVCGAEALVRWQHPRRGLVRPDDFLGLAEREGLGVAVDDFVLHRALEDLRRFDEPGDGDFTTSVNLGFSSTCDPGLPERVLGALHHHGVPPQRLRLEITEHDALPDDEGIRGGLQQLVDHGVGLSLDDFGVGYTSLSYLRRYPIDVLKLDRSLVTPEEPTARTLRAGIVALAGTLDLLVLAEGIEHAWQVEHLRDLGITLGQGYHFSPAVDAAAFAAYRRARRPVALETHRG